jgi:hypothetical protein
MLHSLPAPPITDPPLETENDLLTLELKVRKYGVLYRRDALALIEMIRALGRDIEDLEYKIVSGGDE